MLNHYCYIVYTDILHYVIHDIKPKICVVHSQLSDTWKMHKNTTKNQNKIYNITLKCKANCQCCTIM